MTALVAVTVIASGDAPTGAVQISVVGEYVDAVPTCFCLVYVSGVPRLSFIDVMPPVRYLSSPLTAPSTTTSSEFAAGVNDAPVVAEIATDPVVRTIPL